MSIGTGDGSKFSNNIFRILPKFQTDAQRRQQEIELEPIENDAGVVSDVQNRLEETLSDGNKMVKCISK